MGYNTKGDDNNKVDNTNYHRKITRYVVAAWLFGAASGLMYGYEIGISGGVTCMGPFLSKFFPQVYGKEEVDQSVKLQYCRFDIVLFIQSLPQYVSGMAACFYHLSMMVGILIANFINFATSEMKDGRRYSLGGAGIIAFFIIMSAYFNSETPDSLIERGKYEEAKQKLKNIGGVVDDIEAGYDHLVDAIRESQKVKHPWRNIRKRKYRPQLVLSIFIPLIQRLTGMSGVLLYAPVHFKTLGLPNDASLFLAVIAGGVNVVATIFVIHKWFRRKMFLLGGIQMFILQIAVAFLSGNIEIGMWGVMTDLSKWYAILVVLCICSVVACYAWSWVALGWVVASKIFPPEIRSAAQSITMAVGMLLDFFAQFFLKMLCGMKYWLFVFFACFVAIMRVFVARFVHET
ncbi:sugar transport protein MST6-like [Cornus florida]|uniref:sugar transport protein MST6-like n=1 Tax=Cornus florida TaxID=4283 RepID=UPI00289992A3|nr:sugar transport protein MST6-like [Cornus florida]